MKNLISKKSLLCIITMLSGGIFASAVTANTTTELLSRFSINDMNQIYQACGNANSNATACANITNQLVQMQVKNFKPISAADVNLVWQHCYDKGDNKLCARNVNAILDAHLPAGTHYHVSEEDIRQINSLNLIDSQDDYSSLIAQVDDFLKQ